MANETSRTIEIPAAQGKIVALLVLSALSTALSAALAFGLIPDLPASAANEDVGRTGLVVFGVSTVIALWRLHATREPPVTLSPAGIRDRRVTPDIIPWRAVKDISSWQVLRQQVVVLAVDEACERQLTFTTIARWLRSGYRANGVDGIVVTTQGLQVGFPALFHACRDYWEAHRRPG